MRHFIIHYGEIALKKNNRGYFENMLRETIASQFKDFAPCSVRKLPGRLWLEFAAPPNLEPIIKRLKKIFGVVNFIPCGHAEVSLEKLKQNLDQELTQKKFSSFAVRAKRCEKNFPLSSQFVNEEIGRFVQKKTQAQVDLENPETTIYIEMFKDHIFYGLSKIPGVGGLPVGMAGQVLGLLSGGIDSPVACYRMMKRGCRVSLIHFYSAPFSSEQSLDKALELAEALGTYQGGGLFLAVPFGDIQREIVAKTEDGYRVLLYRRMMLRIAEVLAKEYGATALVTGESLSQVASQTLSNLATIEEVCTLPLFRPLIGMDKVEIVDQARQMGTYEISIRPHEDCCSFMIPKHPKTHSHPEVLVRLEKDLPLDEWVQNALKEAKRYEV